MEQQSASAALSTRLTANYNELRLKPIKIEAGWDDRMNQLHDCQFIPGAVCQLSHYWERGQQLTPDAGLKPLCCYDMVTLGLNTCVSTKGWIELHDPGSLAISIKYFLPSNVNLSDRASSRQKLSDLLTIEEQLAEPTSVHELGHAVLAAVMAQRLVTPWNYSICPILSFLSSSRYCQNYLAGHQNQAALLREFVDLMLHANANNWKVKQPFSLLRMFRHTGQPLLFRRTSFRRCRWLPEHQLPLLRRDQRYHQQKPLQASGHRQHTGTYVCGSIKETAQHRTVPAVRWGEGPRNSSSNISASSQRREAEPA
jgi:hypothetical protein